MYSLTLHRSQGVTTVGEYAHPTKSDFFTVAMPESGSDAPGRISLFTGPQIFFLSSLKSPAAAHPVQTAKSVLRACKFDRLMLYPEARAAGIDVEPRCWKHWKAA